ncbi:MAG: 5-bromo-4-chloroindolyl phosphate hydrolysis family protein [Pseudomonadota bacterium]
MNEAKDGFAKRIGSRVDTATGPMAALRRRAWSLRLVPIVFTLPLLWSLLSGQLTKLVGLIAGAALLVLGAMLVERGLAATAEYQQRRLAKAPLPYRLTGAAAVGVGFAVIGLLATGSGLVTSLLVGAAGAASCVLTYGLDPKTAKMLDASTAKRTGMQTEQVLKALEEAETKLADIRHSANGLANRELKGRIERIIDRANAVLDEIERDPKDLSRARRFLNTYLDGTRNVIKGYVARQDDFSETELAQNFKNVLATIEKVFDEQVEHLKKDEALDLDVAIDVLHTQLTKEGVG